MKRITGIIVRICLLFSVWVLGPCPGLSQVSGPSTVTLSSFGWTIVAATDSAMLSIYHDSLGNILKDIRLNIRDGDEIKPLTGLNARLITASQLGIITDRPASAWTFEVKPGKIVISGTTSDLLLTGLAPAPADRIVARLIDPEGVPVDWSGTNEITVSFNGRDTHNPSRLPSVNPEVMTFSLGKIDAFNLHALFDRKTDMAVSFPSSAVMLRNADNDDLLDVTIPVPGRTMITIIPDYFTKTLGLPFYSRFDDSEFPSAPQIWGSWTAYYYEAKESDIVSNADWISKNLKPYGFQYVQLDDGYDRGARNGHYWIEHWDRTIFPHGPQWLASYIRSKGLKAGLWLVPNSYAGFFDAHPEWYVYDTLGNVIKDYLTPALDYTNPAVQEWLVRLFRTLTGWGFEYFKFDGEFSLPEYVPDLDRRRLFNSETDPITSYRERLKLIRDVIGPSTFIEGCVAGTPLNGIGYFNSCFNGADMYNSWKGSYAVFSSINANAFLNHMVIYVMPGEGIDVSPLMSPEEAGEKMAPRSIEVAHTREDPFTGFGTTLPEARTLVSVISLTGVAYPLTSILTRLPEERVRLLKNTMPTLPIMPVDLFSRGSDITWDKFKFTTPDTYIHDYPELIDLKVNAASGKYDVAALINWRSGRISRTLSMPDKLGLAKDRPFIVFDFWNQKLLGVYNDSIEVDIDSHDTRVLLIHRKLDHPQLIGTSRHITGAFSVGNLEWDKTEGILTGTSGLVKDEPYSLFVFVPGGKGPDRVTASEDGQDVKVSWQMTGNLLKVDLPGTGGRVIWKIMFLPGND